MKSGWTIVLVLLLSLQRLTHANQLWPHWGHTHSGNFYSEITQIDPQTVVNLKSAWNFTQAVLGQGTSEEATPIVVEDGAGGFIFVYCTGNSVPYGLDPETGELRWSVTQSASPPYYQGGGTCRGVESWNNPNLEQGQLCKVTIFYGTLDMRLFAIDAATGQFCSGFGDVGQVNMCPFIPKCLQTIDGLSTMGVTSPPIVVRNRVIVGNAVSDSVEQNIADGVVLSFSAFDGSFAWQFDPIPHNHSDPAYLTWSGTDNVGGGNVWSCMTGDDFYGIVYLPTTSPSVDQYGGERVGANVYSNSLVAVNATNGEVVWSFQTVHHDLWDYDNPAQPAIMNISLPDQPQVRAIVMPTKMGFLFVFNALTGAPIYEIENMPVPSDSDVPGELPFPTQPYPTFGDMGKLIPLQFSYQDIFANSSSDLQACQNLYNHLQGIQQGKMFTPPSMHGFLQYPLKTGVINYGGIAFDQNKQIIAFKMKNLAFGGVIYFSNTDPPSWCATNPVVINEMVGTPYSVCFTKFQAPSGIPCVQPPYSSLVVMDIQTGQVVWTKPFGYTPGYNEEWGSISGNVGGQLITKSGVFFAAGTDDWNLWAHSIDDGSILAKFSLPAKAQGSPIGYILNSKEYISITAAGRVYTFSL